MKKTIIKNMLALTVILMYASFYSCKDDGADTSAPASIQKVYLENAQSSVPDREVTFARLGQTVRLYGSGFTGITKILVNGENAYFNPVLVTENNIIFQIPTDAPSAKEDGSEDEICIFKGEQSYCFPFDIRSAAPSITNVSHTMPQAGDVIVITGTGLQDVESVTFPGGIEATQFSGNEDGTEIIVTVPGGITASGSITVIGANGGAYSAPHFNYKEGLLHNFDDVQNYSWGSGIDNTALTDIIPNSGDCKSQGGYQVFNPNGNLAAAADQRFWLNSTAAMPVRGFFPASTAAADCGIQMDIYVENTWNSGIIRFAVADGWGSSRYCMVYQPVYPDGTSYDAEAFVNPDCWFTITLPFGASADFAGKTLGDVIAQMSAASYKQCGPWFENSGITDVFDAVAATEKVYFDNIRFVPLAAPTYSDFPDEE